MQTNRPFFHPMPFLIGFHLQRFACNIVLSIENGHKKRLNFQLQLPQRSPSTDLGKASDEGSSGSRFMKWLGLSQGRREPKKPRRMSTFSWSYVLSLLKDCDLQLWSILAYLLYYLHCWQRCWHPVTSVSSSILSAPVRRQIFSFPASSMKLPFCSRLHTISLPEIAKTHILHL